MPTKGDVLDALARVVDPEIGLNIVDVGLVYRVDVVDDRIEIDFTLPSGSWLLKLPNACAKLI